jgi:hypothetical protein
LFVALEWMMVMLVVTLNSIVSLEMHFVAAMMKILITSM